MIYHFAEYNTLNKAVYFIVNSISDFEIFKIVLEKIGIRSYELIIKLPSVFKTTVAFINIAT